MRELCELIGVDVPHATPEQDYMFERPITFHHGDGSTRPGRADCYRRGRFVLEAKKLKTGPHAPGFDDALLRARAQAENYARALPATEGRPPFLLVVDVGSVIEIYAEFSRSGATYTPFPDPRSHRLLLADLARPEVRDTLRRIWLAPESLDPARISAQVTRHVATLLAELAKSLETAPTQHPGQPPAQAAAPDIVAAYLTRCLFSMFAEDVQLLPRGAFLGLLQTHRNDPATLQQMLRILWTDMDQGGFSAALAAPVLHFNGKLFKGAQAEGYSLRLTPAQIELLIQAAQANWREVEPAIFGTLLERALNPTERHALGAHYTPRAYVERLVLPTVIEPLRADWANAQAAALVLAHEATELETQAPAAKTNQDFNALSPEEGKLLNAQWRDERDKHQAAVRAKWRDARQQVKDFHHRLCSLRVLDPACGSANFLYVTLEHLKRLEGEVLNQLDALGETQDALGFGSETVSLQQLRGIEVNERAAALAELVLWIGYLQWHIRTYGNKAVAEPVVHNYGNIECRDAVLAWDSTHPARGANGQLLSRWDGTTFKTHPVTGAQVPDDTAQVPQWNYSGARQAPWPKADFIVGNPPFIGASSLRAALGDGYAQALRAAWQEVPESADFVMYWWQQAAALVAAGKARRFGFITTNSLRQTFNRRVVQAALDKGVALAFAIPDHPWVDSANGAAVRIAMTVGRRADAADATAQAAALGAPAGQAKAGNTASSRLQTVTHEQAGEFGEFDVVLAESTGLIHADLSVGANVASAVALQANANVSSPGVKLHGAGFIVTPEEARLLCPTLAPQSGDGDAPAPHSILRDYRNGRDLTDAPRGVLVIDLFSLKAEQVRERFPAVYQWLLERVKPERDQNNRAIYRENWWLFGEPRQEMRKQLAGLPRYIATVETAKHRTFQFLDASILPDNMLIAIASPDAFDLGILSSHTHIAWALAQGGTLEDRPRYNKSRCFETFPFPGDDTGLTPALRERIAALAEQIDAHRKRVLAQPPAAAETSPAGKLTLTGLYNILEALREGRALTAREKVLHRQGLISVLKELHDELDAAVLSAYGWSDLAPALRPASAALDASELLTRLVALNARRAAEEKTGLIRWLRPEFQNPALAVSNADAALPAPIQTTQQTDLGLTTTPSASASAKAQAWPGALPEQVRAVAQVLSSASAALPLAAIEARFKGRGAWKKSLPRILDTLEALGRARREGDGWRG